LAVIENCNKVFEFDPKNEKALYRRGQAYLGIQEPEKAKSDFEEIIRNDPSNKAAQNSLNVAISDIRKHTQRVKSIYQNMFDKFARADQEKEDAILRAQPDVLEKPGEWGKDKKKNKGEGEGGDNEEEVDSSDIDSETELAQNNDPLDNVSIINDGMGNKTH